MPGISEQIAIKGRGVAQERAGAREASFDELVRRQTRFVFRVAYSVLRNVQDADDVVQETFLKVYRSRAWEQMEDEKAFLARIAWRAAVDVRRKGARQPLDVGTSGGGRSPEEAAIEADWSTVVWRLIDALPEELRQPLALTSIEEMTSREIAQMMGIPEGTVRTRVMRARQILKEKLKDLRYEKRRP